MDSVNDVVKAAFELYAADGKKLNDGDSFTVKLNNGALTICTFRLAASTRCRTTRGHWFWLAA